MRRFAAVNAWIVGLPGRQAVIDTGMFGAETLALWHQAEASEEVGGVQAILATHMHRDHTGQVAYLHDRFGAPLYMSREEHHSLSAASASSAAERKGQMQDYLRAVGADGIAIAAAKPIDYSALEPFPEDFVPLEDGMALSLGGKDWRVLLGGGHSPRAACLLSDDETVFVSGDQILPGAGPHISVRINAPEADPMADYFAFLDRLADIPDTTLVLPGHGAPFVGLAEQAETLRKAHRDRLNSLARQVSGSMTCVEMAPLVFSERAANHFADLLPGMVLSLANHLWYTGTFRRHIDDAGAYRFEVVR